MADRQQREIVEAAEPPEYPASMLVHWPTGPVATCDAHGAQLIGLGHFLGSHIVATRLTEPAECVNCLNEGPPGTDDCPAVVSQESQS